MRKKTGVLLICAALMAGMLSGCSRKAMLVQEQQTEGDRKLITVGFTQVGAESDWRVANTESMQKALSPENGFELLISDAQQKQENQTKAVRDFIAQEVDVIVIAPVTENGWETVLEEAREAGIPVIIVDRRIDVEDESLYTCWVGSDFEKEGVNAAKWLVDYMEKQGRGKEQHHIVILRGTVGSSAEIGRTKGFSGVIESYGNYEIVGGENGDFTQTEGKRAMERCLKRFDEIDVVLSQNDNMAFGAIEAIKEAGIIPGKDIVIISFDAVKAAFEAMVRGELNVSVECNPLHGPRVAEVIKEIMAGKKVEKLQYVEEGIFPAEEAAEELPNRNY